MAPRQPDPRKTFGCGISETQAADIMQAMEEALECIPLCAFCRYNLLSSMLATMIARDFHCVTGARLFVAVNKKIAGMIDVIWKQRRKHGRN